MICLIMDEKRRRLSDSGHKKTAALAAVLYKVDAASRQTVESVVMTQPNYWIPAKKAVAKAKSSAVPAGEK